MVNLLDATNPFKMIGQKKNPFSDSGITKKVEKANVSTNTSTNSLPIPQSIEVKPTRESTSLLIKPLPAITAPSTPKRSGIDFSSIMPQPGRFDPLAQAKVGTRMPEIQNITAGPTQQDRVQSQVGVQNALDVRETNKVGKDNTVGEFLATIWENPEDDLENIRTKFPEFEGIDTQVLGELGATLTTNPEITMEEIRMKFPEIYGEDFKYDPKQAYDGKNTSLKGSLAQSEGRELKDGYIPRFNITEQDTSGGSELGYLGGFGKNILKSAGNLAIDVTNSVINPIDTASGLGKVAVGGLANAVGLDGALEKSNNKWLQGANTTADGLGEMLKARYGSMDAVSKTAYEDPIGFLSDAMTIIGAGGSVLKAGTMGSKTGLAGKIGTVADDMVKVGALDPANKLYAVETNLIGKGIGKGVGLAGKGLDIALPIVKKGVDKVSTSINNKTSKVFDFAKENITGLGKAEREGISSNPYVKEYWDNAKKTIDSIGIPQDLKEVTRPELKKLGENLLGEIESVQNRFSATGPVYKKIKNIDMKVDTSKAPSQLNDILSKHDIKVNSEGKFDFDTSVIINPSDMTAIERVYKKLTNNNELTPKQVLDIRTSLNPLLKRDSNVTSDSQKILRSMRGVIDDIAKDQVPGLKELDAKYSKEINNLNEIKDGLFYRESTRRGELKDNFQSIIKNIGGENRANMRERLLKIMPDLEARVDAVNSIPKLIKAYNTKPNITRNLGGSLAAGVLGYNVGGVSGAVVGSILGYFGDTALQKIRQGSIEKAINSISPKAQERLAEINIKIQNNAKLGDMDKMLLESIKTKISKASEELKSQGVQETIVDIKQYKQSTPALPQKSEGYNLGTSKNPITLKDNSINPSKLKISKIDDVKPKNILAPTKDLQPLYEEARKYKSADQFVKDSMSNPIKGQTYYTSDKGKIRAIGYIKNIEGDNITMYYGNNPKGYKEYVIKKDDFKKRMSDGTYFIKDMIKENDVNKKLSIFEQMTDGEIKKAELRKIREEANK